MKKKKKSFSKKKLLLIFIPIVLIFLIVMFSIDINRRNDREGVFSIGEKRWIESNTDLPVLEQDKQALYVEALTYGYLMSNDSDRAYYQIQLRLVYFQERMCK